MRSTTFPQVQFSPCRCRAKRELLKLVGAGGRRGGPGGTRDAQSCFSVDIQVLRYTPVHFGGRLVLMCLFVDEKVDAEADLAERRPSSACS